MSEQTIQSQDIKIAEVFQAFYVVPDYQREYVWETKHVEQLLNDINAELTGADAAKAPEYFIGSIVVCPGEEGVLDLIDGQQRMTTLFLTLCAIRDRLKELNVEPSRALEPQIAAVAVDASGRDHFRFRLDLQYEDSGGVVVEIANGKPRSGEGATTRSIKNILNAYDVALSFLKQEFRDNVGALRAFYGYLTNKVKLIRIQTEDVAKALKIFETINDRGVGLDSMDLLKNLLFRMADRAQFDALKIIWKELQDTIFDMKEKPLRFLRYFIFSRYDVDALREDDIYGWFSGNKELCGYTSDPLGFAKELLAAGQAYRNFLKDCNQHDKKSRYLENLHLLGGEAARQHLILLLAGRHLTDTLFDRLAREVEELFFAYVITREPTRDFERNFARWATDLRKVTNDAELSDFIERRFAPVKADLAVRFDDAFRRLYSNTVQQYRLRYIMAKLAQHIDLQAFGETEGTKWLRRYTEFEIEHIFPRNPSQGAGAEFGEFADPNVVERRGNLVLVEKSINASLGNRPYAEKCRVYRESQLLLTRALAERPKVGVHTKMDVAVSDLDPFEAWNEAAVATRQEKLGALARSIWNIAAVTNSQGNDATGYESCGTSDPC